MEVYYSNSLAPYPIGRNSDRSTVLKCINDLGIIGRPLLAVKHKFGDLEVYQKLRFNSLELVHTNKGYVNTRAFQLYIKIIFISILLQMLEIYYYQGPAVLIIDKYEPHIITIQNFHLENYNVIVYFLPPHASNQVDPLDTEIFGLMKRDTIN